MQYELSYIILQAATLSLSLSVFSKKPKCLVFLQIYCLFKTDGWSTQASSRVFTHITQPNYAFEVSKKPLPSFLGDYYHAFVILLILTSMLSTLSPREDNFYCQDLNCNWRLSRWVWDITCCEKALSQSIVAWAWQSWLPCTVTTRGSDNVCKQAI